ncbi:hypothetical protein NDU88_002304 [Pleurodeles waltl]|uniref:Uncharacterized protein n=1 Tax=Pleurodeles waltl TaxID=8319 RepID=A0AAV7W2M4_PLEWA|nr:hypothetical protein NDU88_002304 [Pleurodeles waltl]
MEEELEYFPRAYLQEVKGSLTLRSNHLDYGKATLVYNWHESRQADPKDYDVMEAPACRRDLRRSAYNRFGTTKDEDWKTTTEEQLSQICLKKNYLQRDIPKYLITADNIDSAITQRETCRPERGYGAVLPRHHPDHRKMYLKTTYNDAYVPPCRYIPTLLDRGVSAPPAAHKICHSQFVDTACCKRCGINTWQDESGLYANREIKQSICKRTDPIAPCM